MLTEARPRWRGTASRLLSLVLCLPLSVVLLVQPTLLLDSQGGYSHGSLMLVLWGVCIGYVHGMGFDPRAWAWRLAFAPVLGWGLMGLGYGVLGWGVMAVLR